MPSQRTEPRYDSPQQKYTPPPTPPTKPPVKGCECGDIDATACKCDLKTEVEGCECNLEQFKIDLLVEITKIIEANKPEPTKPINKEQHITIVADQKASYWPRLEGEIKGASGYYSAISIAPPPKFSVSLPQLVVYEEGVPIRRSVGLYNVSSDLSNIIRGTFLSGENAGQ